MKKIIIAITGLTGLVLILMTGGAMAENPEKLNLSRAIVKIDSLSCGGCFATINSGMEPLKGYSGMGANLFRKLIAIDFTAPMTAEDVTKTLADIGYPGELKSVENISEKESFAYLESKRTGFTSGGGGGCCSSGRSLENKNNRKQNGAGKSILPSGGSCCTLQPPSQSTENL